MPVVTITVTDAEGDEQKTFATAGHPFWARSQQAWVNAIDLNAGEWLRASAGTWAQVTTTDVKQRHAIVHDLFVMTDHTYRVAGGKAAPPILAHNANPKLKCDLTLDVGPYAREGIALVDGNIEAPGVRDSLRPERSTGAMPVAQRHRVPKGRDLSRTISRQPRRSLKEPRRTAYPHCRRCSRIQRGGRITTRTGATEGILMPKFYAAFEVPIHHGALVVSSVDDAAELSEWDPSVDAYFRDSQSLIFAVQAAVDGKVRCEIWNELPPEEMRQNYRVVHETMEFKSGWRVWDPEGLVQIQLRPVRDARTLSIFVDDRDWPEQVQIVLEDRVP
jgi:hypothetical protein